MRLPTLFPQLVLCGLAAALAPRPVLCAEAAPVSGVEVANFDRAVRPQDDFYRYVDGGWIAATQIPDDRARWGSFDVLNDQARRELRAILDAPLAAGTPPGSDARKLKDFYDSYTDEATVEARGIKPLAPELARIRALRGKADVVAEFAHLSRMGAAAPIAFAIHLDNRDSTRYIFDVYQSGLGMPDRDYYLSDEPRLVDKRAKYQAYVARVLALAGIPDAHGRAATILALETQIAKAQWTKVQDRDPVKTYNRIDTAALAATYGGIDWKRYLAEAGVYGRISDLTVSEPSYLTDLGRIVESASLADWKTYCEWSLFNGAAPYLSASFVDAHFGFYGTTMRDVPSNEIRWKRAVRATESAMGEALGREYVRRTFPPEAKARAEALVANVLAAFRGSIDTLEWMSPATKVEAQAKLAAFTTKIGYPARWRDYSRLVVAPGDLYGNVVRASRFEADRNIAKLGKPVDRGEWGLTPQAINAYYNPEFNEIVFPAAILQPPFFQANADDAVNYGAIGAVIGHEISHGFDDQGSQFDGKGNLRDWWTPADHEQFAAKTHALVEQYSRFEPVKGYFVNGQLTLGENIGDNSGLAVAYKAYRISLGGRQAPVIDGFTGDQRFYIGYAQIWRSKVRESEAVRRLKVDPHAPDEVRIRGTLANQDAFFDAFGIKQGDAMYNPADARVHIW